MICSGTLIFQFAIHNPPLEAGFRIVGVFRKFLATLIMTNLIFKLFWTNMNEDKKFLLHVTVINMEFDK